MKPLICRNDQEGVDRGQSEVYMEVKNSVRSTGRSHEDQHKGKGGVGITFVCLCMCVCV